jgi:hypothetical protein
VQKWMETVRSAFDGNPRPAPWKQISWLELLRTLPRFEGTAFDALDRRVEFELRVPVKMSTGEMNIDSSTDRIRDRSSTSDGRFAIHPKCDRPERQRAANPESSSHQA